MNENETYYIDLINRHFAGEITEEELRILSSWMSADPQHEELFRQYMKTWQLIEEQNIRSTIDTEQEWIAVQAKINKPAATHVDSRKVIALNNDKKSPLSSFLTSWKAAAAVVILLVSSFLIYNYFSKPADIIVTAQAENIDVALPDGSMVSLNAGSELIYPEKFTSGTRKVSLKGEAYFKVAHDKNKPFVVASGDARVEVLGTQFNVNTHSAVNTMEVVLTSGKVTVYYKAKASEKVLLLPGEKAELITDQQLISKSTNTDPNYMAWKTRFIVFEDETLGQVVKTLEHVYQTPVVLADKQLSDCRVTATFNGQSLESVMEVLKETLDLQVKANGRSMEISGKACK